MSNRAVRWRDSVILHLKRFCTVRTGPFLFWRLVRRPDGHRFGSVYRLIIEIVRVEIDLVCPIFDLGEVKYL